MVGRMSWQVSGGGLAAGGRVCEWEAATIRGWSGREMDRRRLETRRAVADGERRVAVGARVGLMATPQRLSFSPFDFGWRRLLRAS
ncbi:unnamed protein product [Linum trigynum]|uniref:Uncharacterized protein n=1 Tax=Linum trigynum TaxID=586398 RepID=A0AAV2CD83_9ROSI